jgi:hypothetical protein
VNGCANLPTSSTAPVAQTLVQSTGSDEILKQVLLADGIAADSVSTDEATNVLRLTLRASRHGVFGDAWAITIAKREANYLSKAGTLSAGSIDLNIVDESGASVWRAIEPMEPAERPVAKTPSQDSLEDLTSFARQTAGEAGFDSTAISLQGNDGLGLILEMDVIVPPGATGVDVAPRVVKEVLPLVLDRALQAAIELDLAHLSVQDANGSILIDYVVDPALGSVAVWGASGVRQEWATPPPLPPQTRAP